MDPDTKEIKIAGIDTQLGLKRIGGKRERYESLLRKFASQQAGAVAAIRAALSSRDAATAERAAHSLKGAAATLGALALAEAASHAEVALKSGFEVDATLESLANALDQVVEAIRAKFPSPSGTDEKI